MRPSICVGRNSAKQHDRSNASESWLVSVWASSRASQYNGALRSDWMLVPDIRGERMTTRLVEMRRERARNAARIRWAKHNEAKLARADMIKRETRLLWLTIPRVIIWGNFFRRQAKRLTVLPFSGHANRRKG